MTGLEAAAPYLLAAAAAVSAVGAISAGQQQAKMAKYNASVAEQQAAAARAQADIAANQHRRRAKLLNSAQQAAIAGSGVTPEGSPLIVMADSAAEAEYDAQLIRYGGEINASQAMSQAALDRMQARSARLGSYFSAGGSLLMGAGLAGTKFGSSGSGGKTVLSAGDFDGTTPGLNAVA